MNTKTENRFSLRDLGRRVRNRWTRAKTGQRAGLERLRTAHPWPDISALSGEPPYLWTLDGGGRHLIIDLIRQEKPKVFLEVGVFLGGSALLWLEHSPRDMTLLAADSWHAAAQEWIIDMGRDPEPWITDLDLVRSLRDPLGEHGMFNVAMHNLRRFRDRVIPLRMPAADLYPHLKKFLDPDIIYIDANKEREDYFLAHEMFPSATLCGCDWEWADASGECPVQDYVGEIARIRRCEVIAEKCTWIIRSR